MSEDKYRIYINKDKNYYYDKRFKTKKNGKLRVIHAPSPGLKKIQKEFAEWFYKKNKNTFDNCKHITGFLPGRSIADNARPHLNKEWVINLDIKDFFPSTSHTFVCQVLHRMVEERNWLSRFIRPWSTGFKAMEDWDLTRLLCLDGGLPQGSPASPILANWIAMIEIDCLLLPLAKKEGFDYTRYADDITFSCKHEYDRSTLIELTNWIHILVDKTSMYKINEEKVKIKHRSQRQEVTGIVVNGDKPGVSKKLRNKLRAIIHNAKCNNKELDDEVNGLLSFVQSINKEQYSKLISKEKTNESN